LNLYRIAVLLYDLIMANSDSDDILSAEFLEPGELLDSDEDEQQDNNSTSARTNQSVLVNRTKVR
jgi:hypothetical protein